MKLKFILTGVMAFMVAGFAQAQVFNWPEDPQMEKLAREKNAAYVDYMRAEEFVAATKPLNWLLKNVPELNESIYINGVAVYDGAQGAVEDKAQKKIYQDSVMTIFGLRKEIYDRENVWIENKASYGYRYFRLEKTEIPELVEIFDRVIEVNGEFATPALLAAYYDIVYKNYVWHKAYDKEGIVNKYDEITALVEAGEANGMNVAQATGVRDQLIVAMELIDCNFIENTLGKKFKANPEDEKLANQIFKYAVQYRCLSTEAFNMALEFIDERNPSFNTSQVRAMRMLQNKDYEKAQPILEKALTLAENDEQKSEVHLDLAKVHAQSGRKGAARSSAMEVVKLGTEKSKDAWTLIAQLYMESFNDCKGGVSRAKDRSVYIAAYNAYQRAGNSSGMNQAKNQFPSKEELFTEGLQAGQTINTGCWIGETVTLATRD